jgi:signal transduction histidine kinase
VKHADASRVEVRVAERDEDVEVVIRDDGRGFETSDPTRGFGLLGIRERVELAHGSLRIESRAGTGTTLRACIPLPERPAGAPAISA